MKRARGLGAALLATLLTLAPPVLATPAIPGVAVDGTSFRVTLSDGSVVPPDRLPGTVLTFGDGSGATRRLRIDQVEQDARDPSGEVTLYGLSEQDGDGAWHNACQPDPDGRRLGFPLAGAFTPGGAYQPGLPGLLITCTGGAEGKCVRLGYKPWGTLPDGTSLLPFYQACVRMVRADYGGDGVGHTRNGMPIDLFDRAGIQRDEPGAGMTLEAAFGPDGALCVAHPRLPNVTLDELARTYPRLSAQLGAACDERVPALLFVRSVPP